MTDDTEFGSENVAIWAPDRVRVSDAPERKKLDTTGWDVRQVHEGSTGITYAIYNGPNHVASVKHSTRFDSMCCMTDRVGDQGKPTRFNSCQHTKFVRAALERNVTYATQKAS